MSAGRYPPSPTSPTTETSGPSSARSRNGSAWCPPPGSRCALNDQSIGAITVYARAPNRWIAEDIAAAEAMGDMATACLINASALRRQVELNGQLRSALDSRLVIEQAKGMVAPPGSVTVKEAFERIRGHARSHHVRVRHSLRGHRGSRDADLNFPGRLDRQLDDRPRLKSAGRTQDPTRPRGKGRDGSPADDRTGSPERRGVRGSVRPGCGGSAPCGDRSPVATTRGAGEHSSITSHGRLVAQPRNTYAGLGQCARGRSRVCWAPRRVTPRRDRRGGRHRPVSRPPAPGPPRGACDSAPGTTSAGGRRPPRHRSGVGPSRSPWPCRSRPVT